MAIRIYGEPKPQDEHPAVQIKNLQKDQILHWKDKYGIHQFAAVRRVYDDHVAVAQIAPATKSTKYYDDPRASLGDKDNVKLHGTSDLIDGTGLVPGSFYGHFAIADNDHPVILDQAYLNRNRVDDMDGIVVSPSESREMDEHDPRSVPQKQKRATGAKPARSKTPDEAPSLLSAVREAARSVPDPVFTQPPARTRKLPSVSIPREPDPSDDYQLE